jgi:CO/xanthine dehydrogenase Mo-binding subunit/aerobic-type carbon monoxide dehydrogenase small subunit (CoxS/CutS family)
MSRRTFLQTTLVAGVSIMVECLAPRAAAAPVENQVPPSPGWIDASGRARYRVDAIAKVTGQKTFARDFRARDIPGWPATQSHAFLVHARHADRRFEGIDPTSLGSDLQPDRLVLAEDLARDGVQVPHPDFYGDFFLVPRGETPRLLGQPVAMLIYRDFARYDAAKRKIRFDDGVVRFGATTGPRPPPHYGAARYVRIEGATPDARDEFSALEGTVIFGRFEGDNVIWPVADAHAGGMAKGMAMAARIEHEMAAATDDALVLERGYFSQSIDASAMEADNGNVWYDPAAQVLHAVLATQSPHEVATTAAAMVTKSKFGLQAIDLKAGHTVGFGTKDKIVFPYFCVIAGLYGDGLPVRLANDRFEQFQMGMKRHAFRIRDTLVIDRKTHRFRIMKAEFRSDGGGRPNLSFVVGMVGTTAAQSIYYLPKSDFSVVALASRAVEAGSTRGFGTLQTVSATEMLVDEAAAALGLDAIDLRLANVFRSGMKNTQGAVPTGALRNDEMLRKAKAHPLWAERETRKTQYDATHPGRRYGVGFAQVQKNYGSGGEATLATLELDRDGRLTMRHAAHELGPGATTSQAVIVARILGRAPEQVHHGVVEWPEMPLTSTELPFSTSQATEDALQRNPRWTPTFMSPMATSNSAHFFGHATRQAARLLLRYGIWPAARTLWGRSGQQIVPDTLGPDDLRVTDGEFSAGDLEPLSLPALATKAHELGVVTGACVHAFNRREWTEAEFDLPGAERVRLPIDALAVKYGDGASPALKRRMTTGGFHFIERATVRYPPVQRINRRRHGLCTDGDAGRACGRYRDRRRRNALAPFAARLWPADRAAARFGSDPGRRRDGHRPCTARVPATLRGRARRWHLELEPLPAPARIRRRHVDADGGSAATALRFGSAERHRRGDDDRDRAGDRERRAPRDRQAVLRVPDHARENPGSALMSRATAPLALTVNGGDVGPIDVPDSVMMLDFLNEYLNLTGARLGCGIGVCHACTIIVDLPDGRSEEVRTCITAAHSFAGKRIRTVEAHAERDAQGKPVKLSAVQQAFIEHFAFQCGYCTSGFVTGATVLIERLQREPVARQDLERTIMEALDRHICRCTGYVRYSEAVRAVVLATPGLVTN